MVNLLMIIGVSIGFPMHDTASNSIHNQDGLELDGLDNTAGADLAAALPLHGYKNPCGLQIDEAYKTILPTGKLLEQIERRLLATEKYLSELRVHYRNRLHLEAEDFANEISIKGFELETVRQDLKIAADHVSITEKSPVNGLID